mmetsp:Transcript_4798/g.10083  ORF Transcript_4798/g.10083 Transcript_4798/m.10083 type:complete len:588 (-) Transcript_4798:255-2018(-)
MGNAFFKHIWSRIHCKYFCKGKHCKREDFRKQKKYATSHAIPGLHSSWATEDIIACQRPSSRLIKEYELIDSFKKAGIGAVVNLQERGEHPHCGDGIHRSSGFSYFPAEFMDHDIFFYNFSWCDMTVPTMEQMLDIVQVIDFTIQSGRKVAIHCHAGLGRTGIVISCYLVYKRHFSSLKAIRTVRKRRRGSVQTRHQAQFVVAFGEYLRRLRITFADDQAPHFLPTREELEVAKGSKSGRKPDLGVVGTDTEDLATDLGPGTVDSERMPAEPVQPLSLADTVIRQRRYLHGDEAQRYGRSPKLVVLILARLKALFEETPKNERSKFLDPFIIRVEEKEQELKGECTESSFFSLLSSVSDMKHRVNDDDYSGILSNTEKNILLILLVDFFYQLESSILPRHFLLTAAYPKSSDEWVKLLLRLPSSHQQTLLHVLGYMVMFCEKSRREEVFASVTKLCTRNCPSATSSGAVAIQLPSSSSLRPRSRRVLPSESFLTGKELAHDVDWSAASNTSGDTWGSQQYIFAEQLVQGLFIELENGRLKPQDFGRSCWKERETQTSLQALLDTHKMEVGGDRLRAKKREKVKSIMK